MSEGSLPPFGISGTKSLPGALKRALGAIFGGMEFGETNLASRIIYTAVGLSAVYLLSRVRALLGDRERMPSAA